MPDYGASLPVRLCNFGHPSVSTPGWWGVSEPGAFWTSQRVFFQIARGCPVIPLRAASRAVDRVDFFARLGGRPRRLMRLLLGERAGEHRLERPGASQNHTPATSTNQGSAAARASLRASRATPASQRNAGLGTTLMTTATMGVLFAGGAGPAVQCRTASPPQRPASKMHQRAVSESGRGVLASTIVSALHAPRESAGRRSKCPAADHSR
jgi:hypothetical protein